MRVHMETFWQNQFSEAFGGVVTKDDPPILYWYESWALWFEYDGDAYDDDWSRSLAVMRKWPAWS